MRTWLAYKDLGVGEQFRFVYGPPQSYEAIGDRRVSEEVYTKGRAGWYSDRAGNKFRTGPLTAVKLEVNNTKETR